MARDGHRPLGVRILASGLASALVLAPSLALAQPDAPDAADAAADASADAPSDAQAADIPEVDPAADASEPNPEQLEVARSLYYDGIALVDEGNWTEAADRFERVLAIRDSAVVNYQLATAYKNLGRLVDARDRLERVRTDPTAPLELRDAADRLLREVEASMGRLTLHVTGDTTGARILVNGRETPLVALDVPVPVDPGTVRVIVRRDGAEVAGTSAPVGGDAPSEVVVELEVPAPAPAPAQVAAVPAAPMPPSLIAPPTKRDEPGVLGQWWFWTAVGVVAAGAVTTVVVLGADGDPADTSGVRGNFSPGLLEGRVEAP